MKYLGVVFLLPILLFPSNSSVVRTEHGFIDYSNRLIVSRGTASIVEKTMSQSALNTIEKNLNLYTTY